MTHLSPSDQAAIEAAVRHMDQGESLQPEDATFAFQGKTAALCMGLPLWIAIIGAVVAWWRG